MVTKPPTGDKPNEPEEPTEPPKPLTAEERQVVQVVASNEALNLLLQALDVEDVPFDAALSSYMHCDDSPTDIIVSFAKVNGIAPPVVVDLLKRGFSLTGDLAGVAFWAGIAYAREFPDRVKAAPETADEAK